MFSEIVAALTALAALVVLAEALNRVERADLFEGRHGLFTRFGGLSWCLTPWRWKRHRVVQVLEVLAWAFAALSAGGVLVRPLTPDVDPSWGATACIWSLALFIIRSRVDERP